MEYKLKIMELLFNQIEEKWLKKSVVMKHSLSSSTKTSPWASTFPLESLEWCIILKSNNSNLEVGMMGHICNLSSQKPEAEGMPRA